MPRVDLVYDADCPNVRTARENLMRAFSQAGVAARWQEHCASSPDAPARVRGFGSPSILVDGRDLAGGEPGGAEPSCRIYSVPTELSRAPSVDMIAAALARAARPRAATPSRLRSSLAVLPGLGVALLPKVVCPLCWPAYGAVLGAVGLGFLMRDAWLLPISAGVLLAALGALAWRAKARRGYGPALAGLVASAAILIGKFALDSSVLSYCGIAALVGACVWNAWPPRSTQPSCCACEEPIRA